MAAARLPERGRAVRQLTRCLPAVGVDDVDPHRRLRQGADDAEKRKAAAAKAKAEKEAAQASAEAPAEEA